MTPVDATELSKVKSFDALFILVFGIKKASGVFRKLDKKNGSKLNFMYALP